jgi:hypothetical protein
MFCALLPPSAQAIRSGSNFPYTAMVARHTVHDRRVTVAHVIETNVVVR